MRVLYVIQLSVYFMFILFIFKIVHCWKYFKYVVHLSKPVPVIDDTVGQTVLSWIASTYLSGSAASASVLSVSSPVYVPMDIKNLL